MPWSRICWTMYVSMDYRVQALKIFQRVILVVTILVMNVVTCRNNAVMGLPQLTGALSRGSPVD